MKTKIANIYPKQTILSLKGVYIGYSYYVYDVKHRKRYKSAIISFDINPRLC